MVHVPCSEWQNDDKNHFINALTVDVAIARMDGKENGKTNKDEFSVFTCCDNDK